MLRAGRGTLAVAAIFAMSSALFAAYFHGLRHSRVDYWSDTYEYADVARNVALGRGLLIDAAALRDTARLGLGPPPLPYFHHDPGVSLLLALSFAVVGPTESAIAWTSGTCYAITVVLAGALALLVFGRIAAVLAIALVATNAQLIHYSATGLSEVPYACSLTGLLLGLVLSRGRPAGLFGCGLVFSWLVVLRSNSLPFFPWLLGFAAMSLDDPKAPTPWSRLRRVAVPFVLGFLLAQAPWAVRNWRALGHPLHNLQSEVMLLYYTSALGDLKSSPVQATDAPLPDAILYLLGHPNELAEKMYFQLQRAAGQVLLGGGVSLTDAGLLLLVIVALVAHAAERHSLRGRLAALLLLMALTALVVGSIYNLRWRHLYAFLPAGLVHAAGLLAQGLERAGSKGALGVRLAATMVALAAAGSLPHFQRPLRGAALERDRSFRSLSHFLRRQTPEEALLLVDPTERIPLSALAWYGGRSYLTYSEKALALSLAHAGERPLYYLKLAGPHEPPGALTGRGPSAGFVRVGRWDDALGDARAVLLRSRAEPGDPQGSSGR